MSEREKPRTFEAVLATIVLASLYAWSKYEALPVETQELYKIIAVVACLGFITIPLAIYAGIQLSQRTTSEYEAFPRMHIDPEKQD